MKCLETITITLLSPPQITFYFLMSRNMIKRGPKMSGISPELWDTHNHKLLEPSTKCLEGTLREVFRNPPFSNLHESPG